MLAGVNILADAVKLTLGPRGRNLIPERSYDAPPVTMGTVTRMRKVEAPKRIPAPFLRITDPLFKYVPSFSTDLRATFARIRLQQRSE
jgi:hypothetical protein